MAMLLFGVLVILAGIVVALYGGIIDKDLAMISPLMVFAGIILAFFSQIPVKEYYRFNQ